MSVFITDIQERDRLFHTLIHSRSTPERDERLEYYAQPEHLPEFLPYYMPQAFDQEMQDHHLVELQCLQVRGNLVVVVLPRDYGKTTIADGFTVYNVAYGLDPYIMRFEHDLSTGQRQINNLVNAFTTNETIMADFDVTPGTIWRPRFGELSFVNRNPYAHYKDLMVRYAGIQNIARGTSYDFSRISLAIFNDVVKNRMEARSAARNQMVWDIVKADVGMAGAAYTSGTPISMIFITTIQAQGDISDRLCHDPSAMVYKVPAIQGEESVVKAFVEYVSNDIPHIQAFKESLQGKPPHLTGYQITSDDHRIYCESHPEYVRFFKEVTSSWPHVFPLWDFVFEIEQAGSDIFLQERQHITSDTKFQKFYHEWYLDYDELPACDDLVFGMGIDLSGEPKEGTDPMAIVCGAYRISTGDVYILEVWCDQATPEGVIEQAHRMYQRNIRGLGREGHVFLEAIVSATGMGRSYFRTLSAKNLDQNPALWAELPVMEIIQTIKKDLRLASMRPITEQRKIHVIRGQSQQNLLIEQWCNWVGQNPHKPLPIEFKIDAADAMTLLVENLRKMGRGIGKPAWIVPNSKTTQKKQIGKHGFMTTKMFQGRK
jgi:hypothetical protein